MDPIQTALVKKGADAAIDEAQGFLKTLLGPATHEVGLILQEKVILWRLKNQLRVLGKAQEMLKEAGVGLRPVTLKMLAPLLEHASLEEDEHLQTMWAALLANAASSQSADTPTSFIDILREMSPREAMLLNAVYDAVYKDLTRLNLRISADSLRHGRKFSHDSLGHLYVELGLSEIPWAMTHGDYEKYGDKVHVQKSQFEIALDNLLRLRLLSEEREVELRMNTLPENFGQFPGGVSYSDVITLTGLGLEFVIACRKPTKQP